jgi:aconitate hydratase
MLPLTFDNPADYEKIQETDRISIAGLKDLAPGKVVTVRIHHADGRDETIQCRHSFSAEQLAWFKAGSALNLFKEDA